jgi:RNA recognition motif-containing protein
LTNNFTISTSSMGSDAPVLAGSAAAPDSSLSKIKPQPNYPPNPTLYLSNIDWSIKRALLKRSLLALFSRHGKVIEVICLRGDAGGGKPLRGQAWVIFESISAATAAIQAERGFVFFGRPLMVNYAKEVSDRIAKRDGTYTAKTKRAAKRKTEDAGEDSDAAKMSKFSSHSGAVTSVHDPSLLVGQHGSALPPATIASTADFGVAKKSVGIQASSTPSSLLVAKNLPTECNDMMLAMLFRQYSGYKEVKLVGGGVATIEFGTENEATSALKGLNGFKLTTSATLDLNYGER